MPGTSGEGPPSDQSPPASRRARLRERTFGEVLDDTIGLYKEHWRLLLPLSALVMVPVGLFNFPLQVFLRSQFGESFTVSESDIGSLALAGLSSLVVTSLALVFLRGAVARLTSELCLGRTPSVGEAARFARAHFGRLLGVWILFVIVLGLGIFPGVILLFVPYFVALASFQFGPIAVVVEGAGPWRAMGRSWELSKGFRWKVLGTVVLVFMIKSVAGMVLAFPLEIAGFVVEIVTGATVVSAFLSSLASTLAAVLTAPALTIALTLLYFDLRVRKEAFDLSVMARELSASSA